MENDKILGWKVVDIQNLVDLIKMNKKEQLISIFSKFATYTGKNLFSVRNFYYKLLKMSRNNQKIREKLRKNDIILNFSTTRFTEQDEKLLLLTLLDYSKKDSIRQACARLANFNSKKTIRLQNKYKNLIKNKKDLVNSVLDELKQKGIPTRISNLAQIVPIRVSESKITDAEIDSLFLGLVKMVKNSANEAVKEEVQKLNRNLQNALVDLRRKQTLIEELKEQNRILQEKLQKTNNDLNNEYKKYIPLKLNMDKISMLKEYFKNLKTTKQQNT